MPNFDEVIKQIREALEANGSPLSTVAIAQQIQSLPNSRGLPDSTYRLLLSRNADLFVEVRENEWGLRSWNSTEEGINRVVQRAAGTVSGNGSGRIERFSVISEPYEQIVQKLLDEVVPATSDKAVLDDLTRFHLMESSYKRNELLRNVADANALVPPRLYEQTKNLAWRFPPMMEAKFFVRPDSGKTPQITIRAQFAVPTFLEYQELRSFGESRILQKRYVSKPEVVAPAKFPNVQLNGGDYFLREDSTSTEFTRKSCAPIWYQAELTQRIGGSSVTEYSIPPIASAEAVIKAFSETDQKLLSIEQVALDAPKGLDSQITREKGVRWALIVFKRGEANVKLRITLRAVPERNAVEVTVRLANENPVPSNRPPEDQTFLRTLVLPHMQVTIGQAQILIGPQQHMECLKAAYGEGGLSLADQFLADLTTQTNCVLTRSTRETSRLVMASFGVYDTVRVDPANGPRLSQICEDLDSLTRTSTLSDKTIEFLRTPYRTGCVLAVLRAVQRSFRTPKGELEYLWAYQWQAIQNRLEMLSGERPKAASVIRAPTGAGKTVVFFANAALHYLLTGERAVLTFPTRILNEDMFKRLTRFVYALRDELRDVEPRVAERLLGGIMIGTSDPSYNAIVKPVPNQVMVQYDGCPRCQEIGRTSRVLCKLVDGKPVGVCERTDCQHIINYMLGPNQVTDFLPGLTIATPDKLFYEATVSAPHKPLRFFGAPTILCECGYHISLMYKESQINDVLKCNNCGRTIDRAAAKQARRPAVPREIVSPPLYFVLDEIHSLYGMTATLISYFFSLLREMARTFDRDADFQQTFETGTATIANEQELIGAITHQSMAMFPSDAEYATYFPPQPDQVRYRCLTLMPVGKATRSTITNSIVNAYKGGESRTQENVAWRLKTKGAYEFLLAYIPRKINGYTIANELRRVLDNKDLTFLSGDAPTIRMVTILQQIIDGETRLLLANMVVSLGIDIPRLNNMLMLGIPKSMTEMVQTVGRTGRGEFPGHVIIHLQPSVPRDEFVYRQFHRVMGDIKGYFDRKPVAPVNTYVADLMLANVVCALLSARIAENYRNGFCNNAGKWLVSQLRPTLGRLVRDILAREAPADLQREVALTLQAHLNEIGSDLSMKQDALFKWAAGRDDILFSLRARAERVPVNVRQAGLLEAMQQGSAPDWRQEVNDQD